MSQLTDEQKKQARIHFDQLDTDKSGTIEYSELRALLETTLQTKLSDKLFTKYVDAYFHETDKNKDNKIQFEEFLGLYEKLIASKELPISMKPRNSQPKSYAQVDNNAPKMIIPTKAPLTEQEKLDAKKKFEEFDTDKSGTIDREELKKILLTTMKGKVSPAMIERVVNMHMNSGDKDGSGEISLEEFYGIYHQLFGDKKTGGMGLPIMGFAPPMKK